ELPTDRPRPAVQTYRGAMYSEQLPPHVCQALRELSQREGVTLFMTLLAAYQILLSRYANQDDVVVGSPIANRNRSETEGLIGFFVNTLVLRTDLSDDPTCLALLARVRQTTLEAYAHQDVPFEKLVEELDPARNFGQNPLFQVTIAVHNAPLDELTLPGLSVTPLDSELQAVRFDMEWHVWAQPDALRVLIYYNTDLFDEATIARMLHHFQTLLEALLENP